jgi:hypothetical protein
LSLSADALLQEGGAERREPFGWVVENTEDLFSFGDGERDFRLVGNGRSSKCSEY